MNVWTFSICSLFIASSGSHASSVIITEIMYDPASPELRGETEWIEIANRSDETIEIENWRLDDEDDGARQQWGAFSCVLEPRQVAVLVNSGAVDEESFRAAWNDDSSSERADYLIIPIAWGGLANTADRENEILRLLDNEGHVICEVNFQSGGDWPEIPSPGGASIWLHDLTAVDFNDGSVWRRSESSREEARTSRAVAPFAAGDVGSPGVVPGLDTMRTVPSTDRRAPTRPSNSDDDIIDY